MSNTVQVYKYRHHTGVCNNAKHCALLLI